jgi:hypothetical protein
LIAHYRAEHPHLPCCPEDEKKLQPPPSKAVLQASFFRPSSRGQVDNNFRDKLLTLIVENSLAFRIVETSSFKAFVEYLLSTTKIPSRRDLGRDLERTFLSARLIMKATLQEHIKNGGRFSLITDT